MNFQQELRDLLPNWHVLLFTGIRVVFIAIVFEFLAWLAGRRLEALTSPFLSLDGGRETQWRAKRRTTLKHAPKVVARTLLYTVALILVFDAFGLQILPLALAVGAVSLLFGAAMIPTMRDYSQGYVLLSEDTLAPGDIVQIGDHAGVVEKWTLRATWLRDEAGLVHVISNRGVQDVVIHRRAAAPVETSMPNSGTFDPLDAKHSRQPRK